MKKFQNIIFVKVFKDLIKIFDVANLPTYYPDKKRKKYIERLLDLFKWYFKYREINYQYCAYGLDIVGSDPSQYVDYRLSFQKNRDRLNLYGKSNSMSCLLEDKFLFYRTMKSLNLPTPEVFAFYSCGKLLDSDMSEIPFESIADEKDYFLKDAYGLCGNLVKHINSYDDFLEIINKMPKGSFILQRRVFQCAKSAELYPDSINTLRIMTVMKKGEEPYVLGEFHRMGTKISGNVDNSAAGGLSVGVKENGYFNENAFYKYTYGTSEKIHPDTGVVFKDYKIPMHDEAVKLVLKAHKYFYNLHSIGWDIAFTDDGPIIIEANSNWNLSVVQFCGRPMRAAWEEAIKPSQQ